MAVKLIDLKKIAIQKDLEITFKESSSGHAWKIAGTGISNLPSQNHGENPWTILPSKPWGRQTYLALLLRENNRSSTARRWRIFSQRLSKPPMPLKPLMKSTNRGNTALQLARNLMVSVVSGALLVAGAVALPSFKEGSTSLIIPSFSRPGTFRA